MAILDPTYGGYRIFIGDLGPKVLKQDLERAFSQFGRIQDVWVARNPPGYAFLIYKHREEAERAVDRMEGRKVSGRRIRVEHARPFEKRLKDPPRRAGSDGTREDACHRSTSRQPYSDHKRPRSRDHGEKDRPRSKSRSSPSHPRESQLNRHYSEAEIRKRPSSYDRDHYKRRRSEDWPSTDRRHRAEKGEMRTKRVYYEDRMGSGHSAKKARTSSQYEEQLRPATKTDRGNQTDQELLAELLQHKSVPDTAADSGKVVCNGETHSKDAQCSTDGSKTSDLESPERVMESRKKAPRDGERVRHSLSSVVVCVSATASRSNKLEQTTFKPEKPGDKTQTSLAKKPRMMDASCGSDTTTPKGETVTPGGETVTSECNTVISEGDTSIPEGDTVIPVGDKVKALSDTDKTSSDRVTAVSDNMNTVGDTMNVNSDTVLPEGAVVVSESAKPSSPALSPSKTNCSTSPVSVSGRRSSARRNWSGSDSESDISDDDTVPSMRSNLNGNHDNATQIAAVAAQKEDASQTNTPIVEADQTADIPDV